MVDSVFLGKVELFRDLSFSQLKAVLDHCREKAFKGGEKIFAAGEEPRYLYAVMEGEVELHWELPGRSARPERAVSTLGEEASFGWSSLVPPQRYGLSATCTGEGCRVIQLDRNGLLDLFQKDPELGYKVMSRLLTLVSNRFLALQDEVAARRGSDIIDRW